MMSGPIPESLRHASTVWPVFDPPGVCVIPKELVGCPRCGTAKAFFLVRQDGAWGCLACLGEYTVSAR